MAVTHVAYGELIYSGAPVLLLFADDEGALATARTAARRAGCRIEGESLLPDAPARFDDQIHASAALVSASSRGDAFDAMLDRLARAGRAGRLAGVVVTPFDLIDAVAAADLPPQVDHLVDPDDETLEEALAAAVERTSERLHDVNRGGATLLQQLSEDAARLASVLASLSEEETAGPDDQGEPAEVDAAFVRNIIRARRLRDQFFRGELFADPAFDTLLDLYAARLEGRRVAVSSLCIAASVPATTALRWIRALTEQGLFVRKADPNDGRRVYIALSDDAARAMSRYLAAVQKSGLPTV